MLLQLIFGVKIGSGWHLSGLDVLGYARTIFQLLGYMLLLDPKFPPFTMALTTIEVPCIHLVCEMQIYVQISMIREIYGKIVRA